jgi:hypothetical protein
MKNNERNSMQLTKRVSRYITFTARVRGENEESTRLFVTPFLDRIALPFHHSDHVTRMSVVQSPKTEVKHTHVVLMNALETLASDDNFYVSNRLVSAITTVTRGGENDVSNVGIGVTTFREKFKKRRIRVSSYMG